MFDKIDFQRLAISSVGALALSAVCLGAAAAPAKAANAPRTAAEWQDDVAHRIQDVREGRSVFVPSKLTPAAVDVHFSADGDFAGATMAKPTGRKALDARAVAVASRVAYPALPAGFRGQPQTVRMNLYFGDVGSELDYVALRARAGRDVQIAGPETNADTQVAAR
jgi:hypothetical protein